MTDQPPTLGEQIDRDLEGLERELAEIGMLVEQARTEASRHEQKRSQAAERAAGLAGSGRAQELADANAQLVTLTRRAAIMESQLDVLAGKQRTLERYRDGLARVRDALGDAGFAVAPVAALAPGGGARRGGEAAAAPTTVGRVVLVAQEDLRREIARALHDGPAQSLANIVLQAQIVDRLLERDPANARAEVAELVAMVQRTLEVTKTFIFDVRPLVLDDLGLVPTLRRVARERSRRSGVPVTFESVGPDRRLPVDLESGVFRIADDALGGLLGGGPEKVTLALDWRDAELVVVASAVHAAAVDAIEGEPSADMPAALRAMVDERRARAAATGGLPGDVVRTIEDRTAAAGGRMEIAGNGRALTVHFPYPAPRSDA
jgi:two-component system sensor histidine kinase DegS